MNSDNGKIWLSLGLDNSQLEKEIREAQMAFKGLGDQVTSDASRMDNAFNSVTRSVASLGAAWSLQEFARKVAEVRGEFQKLEVAMETMLGSKSKAEALMAQMVQTAATTPFGLNDVANGAKQLLAYGVAAEDVNETLIRLGDIAAGLSIPLNDLVYLYGTTMAQGRLYTQDLNQFMGRGIPIAGELAKQFGVAEGKVRSLVEAGEIGFENVKAAIESLTNEGGRFGGLMEAQSKTISGQIANIEDAFDMMLNDIGQSNEGLINDALGATSMLVENYKVVADVLLTAVASYGVYKATLMGVTAYTNACYNYEITQLKTLVAEKGMEVDADLAAAVSKGRMTSARAAEVQALRQELAAKIEAARATAVVAASEASEATRKRMLAQLAYQKARAEVEAKQEEIFAMEGMYAHQTAETLQKEKDVLVTKMHAAQEQLDAASKAENAAVTKAATTAQAVNTLTTQRDTLAKKMNVTQTKLLTICTNGLTKAFKALKAALASNPLGLIMVVATTVIGALMTMNDTLEETSEEVERFGESAVKQVNNVNMLFAVINNTSTKSKAHKDAVDELTKIYEEFGIKIDDERSKLEQLNGTREEVIRLIREEGEERQKANMSAQITENYNKELEAAKNELVENLQSTWAGDLFGLTDMHKELKENATYIAATIERIVGDNMSLIVNKSGQEAYKGVQEIKAKIAEALKDFGISEETVNKEILDIIDGNKTDWLDYISRVKEATENLQSEQEKYNNYVSTATGNIEDEKEEVDYATMSFSDLFDAAYHAKEEVAKVGTLRPKPLVDTSSIDNAITQTDALINNMLYLSGGTMAADGKVWGLNYQLPKFDFASNFGLDVSRFSIGLNNALPSATTTTGNNSQQNALNELDKRVVAAIKTRKGTSDLLKEVNSALETAEVGSDDEKRLLSLQRRLQSQQKKFKTASSTTGESAAQRRANIEKAEQDTQKTIEQNAQSRMELEEKLHFQEEQNNINLERDAAKRKRRQMQLDHEKELSDLEKQKQDAINAEIQRQKAVFDAQENEKKARNKDYVKQNFSENDIDKSQIAAIETQYQTLIDQTLQLQQRNEEALLRSEVESMQAYLKEYGTFQQQKLAIAEEYAAKIRNAETEGERLSLQAESNRAIQQVEINAIKQQIDWGSVFSDFGTMFKDQLQPTIDKLREIAESDTFKQSSLEEQSALYELIDKLENANAAWDSDIFKRVSDDIMAYQAAMRNYTNAVEKARIAEENLTKAKNTLDNAKKGGLDEQAISAAQANVDTARAEFNAASEDVKKFGSQVQETTTSLNSSAAEAKAMFDNLSDGLKGLASGSLEGIGNGVMKLDKLFGGELTKNAGNSLAKGFQSLLGKDSQAAKTLSEALGNSGLAGQIISAILGVLDMLAEGGVGGIVSNLIDTVLGTANGILDDIFSGGIITKPLQSVIDGVGGIIDTITFGALGSWLGGNDKEVMETVNRLTESNEYLRESIDNLKDRISETGNSNVQSIGYYKNAREAELEWEENQRNIIKKLASAWTNSGYGFLGLGGKGSFNKHSPGSGWYGWSEFTQTLKNNGINITVDSTGDLWNLTPEQMALLRDNNPKAWQELFNGDGHKNPKDAVDEYIEHAGELEELTDLLYEQLTGITFDSMYDNFIDKLMDMDADAQDFADDFSEYMMKAMLKDKINSLLGDDLEQWYEDFAEAINDNGKLDEDELEALRKSWEDLTNQGIAIRNDIAAATGYDSTASDTSQESTKKGYATASQDSIDELSGRFTAVQMDTSAIRELMVSVNADFASVRLSAGEIKQHTDEIRNLSLLAIDHLETISKNTFELFEINERLGKIEKNTRNL